MVLALHLEVKALLRDVERWPSPQLVCGPIGEELCGQSEEGPPGAVGELHRLKVARCLQARRVDHQRDGYTCKEKAGMIAGRWDCVSGASLLGLRSPALRCPYLPLCELRLEGGKGGGRCCCPWS